MTSGSRCLQAAREAVSWRMNTKQNRRTPKVATTGTWRRKAPKATRARATTSGSPGWTRASGAGTGSDHAEEFPDFTAFWFERPGPGSGRLTFHALLDSPSVAGAYRFDLYPGAPLVMNI